MRSLKLILPLLAGALGIVIVLPAQQPRETLAWAPQPVTNPGWIAPNKPVWRLSELLAAHKGQSAWRETVVSDATLHADYVSMAPGTKTPRMFHPDNRAWWIVQDGQVKFNIEAEGVQPIVASKGFMVQVPYRNIYSLEVVGDKPALFVEVNIAGDTLLYPADEKPPEMPGFNFVKVRISGKGKYDAANKPYIDFSQVVAGTEKQRRFVADDRAVANIIRGNPQNPKDVDKGHFHEVSSEFWFILEGQIEYKIGSLPLIIADQGDIVYAPKQMWHRATHAGTGFSTRLAMNGYQDLLHDYQPLEELQGK